MNDDLRALLNDVAEGRVDPATAARALEEIDRDGEPGGSVGAGAEGPPADLGSSAGGAPSEQPDPEAVDPGPARAVTDRVDLVRVQASARQVRVIADPAVATVSVDGPHSVTRHGSTVRVDGPVNPAGTSGAGTYQYERKTGLSRWISQASLVGVPMTVRVNPTLAVSAEVTAGSLDVHALRGPLTFSVTAGSVRATDCSGPVDGVVRAGSAKLDLRPQQGRSTVRVESGSVDLKLMPGSDVRVTAHAELGEVKVRSSDGTTSRLLESGEARELVVGNGTATFDLDVVMGSVKVRVP
jgi:hypothetical protein